MYTVNRRFEWDFNKANSNLQKHDVSFHQAISAFQDPDAIEFEDLAHSQREERFKLLGLSDAAILIIVFTVRDAGEIFRIISARRATRQERRDYHEEKRKNRFE
jgi:uncharacterized DUF497 family protein